MARVALLAAVVVVALTCVAPASATRPPTFTEKVAIMDAFNIPGRAFASKCVLIQVSTRDELWAILSAPRRPPRACVKAGMVGDGFVLFRRASPSALRWKKVLEGSGFVPCVLPVPVREDFFETATCG